MSNKDKTSASRAAKRAAAATRKSGPPRRRTRMFALEPRVLFDGALAADIVAEAGKVADAAAAAAGQAAAPADAALFGDTEKPVAGVATTNDALAGDLSGRVAATEAERSVLDGLPIAPSGHELLIIDGS